MTADLLICRRSLSLRSGAGRLILLQASGLEALGLRVAIAASRGRFRFMLGSGRLPRKLSIERVRKCARGELIFVVDNDLCIPEAGVTFVHNLQAGLVEQLPGAVSQDDLTAERRHLESIGADCIIVANSQLVRDALVRRFDIAASSIIVHYPGYDEQRYSPAVRDRLRASSRRALGIGQASPLIGIVTSGHFAKRGLDTFLETASRILEARADARFLVVGSSELPASAAGHPLVRDGSVVYRPKTRAPERYFAALDIFLYSAVFEEFGIVVTEAQAMGIPVVVSDRVGAAETLPRQYVDWGLPAHAPGEFAAKCLELLEVPEFASRLAAAALASVSEWGGERYAAATAATILAGKRHIRSAGSNKR